MGKKLKRVWLAVEEDIHEKVVNMADLEDRTIHGQYRRLITEGLEQQLERNRNFNTGKGEKRLLRASGESLRRSDEEKSA